MKTYYNLTCCCSLAGTEACELCIMRQQESDPSINTGSTGNKWDTYASKVHRKVVRRKYDEQGRVIEEITDTWIQ